MLMPLLEKESSRAGTDHYLSALSARVAGGQVITDDTKPKVSITKLVESVYLCYTDHCR